MPKQLSEKELDVVLRAAAKFPEGGSIDDIAAMFIKRRALDKVARQDRARFIEVVETEIMGLHEGNIARYRLRPSEYHKWREVPG